MRILVIDDELEIRDFLKANLESECFVVETAGNGEDGSYLARTNEYDLVILDNILPRKNGMNVCRDIRASAKTFPILVLSVQINPHEKAAFLNAGADDYITKPFSYEELLSRIRALLRRPRKILPPVIEIDDLTIDTCNQRVKRGDAYIHLTRKEFAITEYLARNHGTVVSRGILMEHVWHSDINPFSNTIESHVLNLRKKIDVPDKKKLIYTIPGRGYKMECRPD